MKRIIHALFILISFIFTVDIHAVPPGSGVLYYVHNDAQGTPQALTDESGDVVWTAETDPFGGAKVDEDPDGDGKTVEFNVRFPGQYYDKETGLHYNGFRYYSPETGRYLTSDPIGLGGGLNTYSYALSNPIRYFDIDGLEVRYICRPLGGLLGRTGKQHCFAHVTCPAEGWSATYSLFATSTNFFGIPNQGAKALNDQRDDPNSPSNASNGSVGINSCPTEECGFEKAVRDRFISFPIGNVPYNAFGPNSNTFASDLVTGTPFGGELPPGAPGPGVAPGIDQPHPNFP